jgi:hypothetical protein
MTLTFLVQVAVTSMFIAAAITALVDFTPAVAYVVGSVQQRRSLPTGGWSSQAAADLDASLNTLVRHTVLWAACIVGCLRSLPP